MHNFVHMHLMRKRRKQQWRFQPPSTVAVLLALTALQLKVHICHRSRPSAVSSKAALASMPAAPVIPEMRMATVAPFTSIDPRERPSSK